MVRICITDEMWSRLEPLLPKLPGRPPKDNRNFLEAVCWVLRTGAPWRDLPLSFGPWKTVYNRYKRWVERGYLDRILIFFKRRWGSRMAHS